MSRCVVLMQKWGEKRCIYQSLDVLGLESASESVRVLIHH